jgi:isopentenyldiphosphate isomerase
MAKERIAVVDERNRFVRWADRLEVHGNHLPHRSVHIFVFTTDHRLVLQKRHRQKLTFASTWDISCSGHVEESDYPAGPDDRLDEVYASVARRELLEELAIEPTIELVGHFGPEPGVHYEQFHLYRAIHDGPYKIQEEELEELRVVGRDELASIQPRTPTLDWGLRWLESRSLAWPSRLG